jgi:hypothetical protein
MPPAGAGESRRTHILSVPSRHRQAAADRSGRDQAENIVEGHDRPALGGVGAIEEFNAYRRAAKSSRLAIPIGIAKAAAVPRPRRQSLCA